MDEERTWRVGNAQFPSDADPRFPTVESAIAAAMELARGRFSVAIAVWDDHDDIVYLFLCGQEFRSV